jgi:peptidoglycan glycosyltransferase
MGGSPGALVALDPRNGDILAMVSNPGFDPNVPIDDQFEALTSREDSPLLNRATQGLYTPGSTFKTVTLAAALQAGLVDAKTPATCPATIDVLGFPVTSHNEPPGKHTTNTADAYAYSCNTYFAQLGIQVGAERLTDMARGFGILDEAPFELPTVAGRLFTTPGYMSSDQGLAVTAFGQGELQVSPLQLALVAAAVANDGMVPKPRLLMSTQPEDWRRAMSPEAAHELAGIMEYGVQQGWAATAAVPGVNVGGKTGSAEVAPGESSHAVFIAFAPVEDPKIAIAVLKERAGAGSVEAGPVVKAVLEAALK